MFKGFAPGFLLRVQSPWWLQTAVESDRALASASTLYRFEHRAEREEAVRLHDVLEEQLVASYKRPPRRVIVKAEHTARGSNPRYVVTNLADRPQHL